MCGKGQEVFGSIFESVLASNTTDVIPGFSETAITAFSGSPITGRKTQREGERQIEQDSETKDVNSIHGIPRDGKRGNSDAGVF